MARVNITLPDELLAEARAAGLNVSRTAAAALRSELERQAKVAELDTYLRRLSVEMGPIPEHELRDARAWADRAFGDAGPTSASPSPKAGNPAKRSA